MNGIHEVTGSIPVWSTILSFTVSISAKPRRVKEIAQVGHGDQFVAADIDAAKQSHVHRHWVLAGCQLWMMWMP